jgi:hypothetical protein
LKISESVSKKKLPIFLLRGQRFSIFSSDLIMLLYTRQSSMKMDLVNLRIKDLYIYILKHKITFFLGNKYIDFGDIS